jgi:preprotein translocase subunit SecA
MFKFLEKLLDANARELERLVPIVERINSLESEMKKLSEEDFAGKTAEFRLRLERGETLDDILPEAFACVRELSYRVNNEHPFDVQLMAGIALHKGKVVEQKTGEGKTLSAVHALYLNALTGKGCHLVTVNDYLARRDCGWMGPIYHALGITSAAIMHDASFIFDPAFTDKEATDWRLMHLRSISRKEAYEADITYGVNSEFGFDYLRDNMASTLSEVVQRPFHFAIVDEVDSVLIDEARTPHIIAAPDTRPTQKYYEFARLIGKLNPATDFMIDEKLKTAHLTEHGTVKVEKMLGIPNLYEKDFEAIHHIENALKARELFFRDRDYVVKESEIILVDEFTGRLMFGRRLSAGLHQAIEAKEGVSIKQESRTLATVSLQNYFRMYEKLAGMTGTAATEVEEFQRIYGLDVIVVPTNEPMIRQDHPDQVYKTAKAKYTAVAREIAERYKKGQPVLVGTTSIEKNEIVSKLLTHKGISHEVLNAKNHEKEARILAKAGAKRVVTVATNIAGRGVDIVLGGEIPKDGMGRVSQKSLEFKAWQKVHEEVVKLGGLHVIGTERHESRRIDNQLRGRSGRQGDPGSSRFYVSLEDDIMRLFGGEQVKRIMDRFKMPEDVPLEHSMVSRAIEQAQIKVEGFYFDMRKRVVEYDDVMNKQREVVYKMRREILEKGTKEKEGFFQKEILEKIDKEIQNLVFLHAPEGLTTEELRKIIIEFLSIVPFDSSTQREIRKKLDQIKSSEEAVGFLTNLAHKAYEEKEKQLGANLMRQAERLVFLNTIDRLWMDHLDAIDDLREGIGLRGYAQKDPLVEYKAEAFSVFERFMESIDWQVVHRIFKIQAQIRPVSVLPQKMVATGGDLTALAARPTLAQTPNKAAGFTKTVEGTVVRKSKKVGRNDPCPCGATKPDGTPKKYKHCCYPKYG